MSTRIYTSTVLVRINTGPPTWWLPRFKVEIDRMLHIKAGWLRACIQIGWGVARHPEAEREELASERHHER